MVWADEWVGLDGLAGWFGRVSGLIWADEWVGLDGLAGWLGRVSGLVSEWVSQSFSESVSAVGLRACVHACAHACICVFTRLFTCYLHYERSGIATSQSARFPELITATRTFAIFT